MLSLPDSRLRDFTGVILVSEDTWIYLKIPEDTSYMEYFINVIWLTPAIEMRWMEKSTK